MVEIRNRSVPAVEIIDESDQPDAELCTTELCLPNNAANTTSQGFRSYELDTMVSQEIEHNISDLVDDLILSDQLSHSADNEGSIAAGSGTQSNQIPIYY